MLWMTLALLAVAWPGLMAAMGRAAVTLAMTPLYRLEAARRL